MSLTDSQIRELCIKMKIPLASDLGIIFKDECPDELEYNKTYFINLEDEYNKDGTLNSGSHWTAFQIAKYKNGNVEPMYFDSMGMPCPENIKNIVMKQTKKKMPFSTKNIQSLMSNACGWFCCAWSHFINNFSKRTGDIYADTEHFLSFFEDLNKSSNFLKNEYILKLFFQSEDPKLRKEIKTIADMDTITNDTNGGIDAFKISGTKLEL
jgi:hypothetical protein